MPKSEVNAIMSNRESRPNILIIMSDQHNPHFLGCSGNSIVRTPNLDRLASEGMIFTNAYCPAPLCVPSRMSFMTGRTPSRNRVWDNTHILSSGIPTWTHYLAAAGYETALIGRMHFVGSDQMHGFEKRPLGEYSSAPPGIPLKGGPAWTKYSSDSTGQSRESVEIAGTGTTGYQIYDRMVVEATCRYLTRKAHGDGRPFAAVSGFLLPHNPYIAPKALVDYYMQAADMPCVEENQPPTVRRMLQARGLLNPLTPEQTRRARAAYYALCDLFDSNVGTVLKRLDQTGLADNTLVVYCSDHGDMAGEHGCWTKSCYYEGSAGIPLIARLPGVVEAGTRCDAVCSLLDIGPTLVELAGGEPMHGIDGRPLLPLLRSGDAHGWADETYSEFMGLRVWPRHALQDNYPAMPSRMIRSGPWKLWLYADAEKLPPALFNLESDPNETTDLAADPTYAQVVAELSAKILRGWNPAAASAESIDATLSRNTIGKWGAVVRPEAPLAVPYPPPEAEADVRLFQNGPQ
ncbi:MAG: sulfatase-like hydrolase/transferase [Planctomycetes bacterium]|nr:sulfatase-like hydrolase/transferase [Planctomycetota bacterium]